MLLTIQKSECVPSWNSARADDLYEYTWVFVVTPCWIMQSSSGWKTGSPWNQRKRFFSKGMGTRRATQGGGSREGLYIFKPRGTRRREEMPRGQKRSDTPAHILCHNSFLIVFRGATTNYKKREALKSKLIEEGQEEEGIVDQHFLLKL